MRYVVENPDQTAYDAGSMPEGQWGWIQPVGVVVNWDGKKYVKPSAQIVPDFRKGHDILIVKKEGSFLLDTGSYLGEFPQAKDDTVITVHLLPIVKETRLTRDYMLIVGGRRVHPIVSPNSFW